MAPSLIHAGHDALEQAVSGPRESTDESRKSCGVTPGAPSARALLPVVRVIMKTPSRCWAILLLAQATVHRPALAADAAADAPDAHAARSMDAVPSGVDTYTAFAGEHVLGAAALAGAQTGRQETGGTALAGGARLWVGFLERVTVQGEFGRDLEGRYSPSAAAAIRVFGDRRRGWALGTLGRYRTRGLSTIEGEVEMGLLGSYRRNKLNIDLNVVAGVGVAEEEADAESALRLSYDLSDLFRLGLEGRVRRELREERDRPSEEGEGEWDAFAGVQASFAFQRFFAMVTAGPQKQRLGDEVGVAGQLLVGGVTF